MEAAQIKNYTTLYPHEDENFWRKHASDFSLFRLTKTDYCRKNGLNYGRFYYQLKKLALLQQPQSNTKATQIDEKRHNTLALKGAVLPKKRCAFLKNYIKSSERQKIKISRQISAMMFDKKNQNP